MKKILFVLSIMLIIMLSGCATKYVCDDGSTVTDPTECKAEAEEEEEDDKQEVVMMDEEEEEEKEEEVKPVLKNIDPNVQALFDKVKAKNNFQYLYKAPKGEFSKKVYVRGKFIKEEYLGDQYVDGGKLSDNRYDTIFFDTDRKTAYRMCLDKELCENTTLAKKLSYNEYYMGTMIGLIDSISVGKDTDRTEMVGGRKTIVIDYKLEDNQEGRMWIDQWYGTPMKLEYLGSDGKKTSEEFSEYEPDSVTEGMVKMPAVAVVTE